MNCDIKFPKDPRRSLFLSTPGISRGRSMKSRRGHLPDVPWERFCLRCSARHSACTRWHAPYPVTRTRGDLVALNWWVGGARGSDVEWRERLVRTSSPLPADARSHHLCSGGNRHGVGASGRSEVGYSPEARWTAHAHPPRIGGLSRMLPLW